MSVTFLSLLAAACLPLGGRASNTNYTPQPFEHYQPILDRMPFGAPPPAQSSDQATQVTDAQTQAEQQKLAKQVNMSCVNVTPDGTTAIGFTDLGEKPPANYYLLVGATAGGWTVVDANYDEEWAQIEKDGVTITLQLGKGLIQAPPVAPVMAPVAVQPNLIAVSNAAEPSDKLSPVTPMVAPPRILLASKAGRPVPNITLNRLSEIQKTKDDIEKLKSEGGDVDSYRARLAERKKAEYEEKKATEQAAREKLQELARQITEQELKKREREINLELISQGAHPISDIELTPEEEASLEASGVLPR